MAGRRNKPTAAKVLAGNPGEIRRAGSRRTAIAPKPA